MKKCLMCGLISGPSNHAPGRSYCKACASKKALAWRAANLDRAKATARKYRAANRQRCNARRAANLAVDPIRGRYKAWKAAGINMIPETYEALLQRQEYSCAICKRHESEFSRRLAVDHNHETGQIRGLLCTPCNSLVVTAVERFAPLLSKAADYLKHYSEGTI